VPEFSLGTHWGHKTVFLDSLCHIEEVSLKVVNSAKSFNVPEKS